MRVHPSDGQHGLPRRGGARPAAAPAAGRQPAAERQERLTAANLLNIPPPL